MTQRLYTKTILLIALVAVSLGGFLLHLRIHSVSQNPSNIIPVIAGILSIIIVPLLLSYKNTIHYGYVLNGFLAIIGTIVMAHFSIAHRPYPLTLEAIMLNTTLADILIVWSKFFIGKAIFELEIFGYDHDKPKKGITYRYPNLGWWLVHLVALSTVYTLGSYLWR